MKHDTLNNTDSTANIAEYSRTTDRVHVESLNEGESHKNQPTTTDGGSKPKSQCC